MIPPEFNTQLRSVKLLWFLASVLIFFAGCDSNPVTIDVHATEPMEPSAQGNEGIISDEGVTVRPEISPAPHQTDTPTPLIPWTPLPTLLPNDAQDKVLELLETNGNCLFPCWWGEIIPGETSWDSAQHFLQSFAPEFRREGGGTSVERYRVVFTVPETIVFGGKLEVVFRVSNDIIDLIFLGQNLGLEYLLREFGVPDEIIVSIQGEASVDPGRFFTMALYWSNGVMASFRGQQLKGNPELLCIDLSNNLTPVWLFDPSNPRSAVEIGGEILAGSRPYNLEFQPLEEVANLDPASFYDAFFTAGDNPVCFNEITPEQYPVLNQLPKNWSFDNAIPLSS